MLSLYKFKYKKRLEGGRNQTQDLQAMIRPRQLPKNLKRNFNLIIVGEKISFWVTINLSDGSIPLFSLLLIW